MVYNAAHSYLAPMAMMTAGFATASPLVLSIAMIWLAHIGFDRALGYGLKYAGGFGFTHMGRIGKPSVKTRPARESIEPVRRSASACARRRRNAAPADSISISTS